MPVSIILGGKAPQNVYFNPFIGKQICQNTQEDTFVALKTVKCKEFKTWFINFTRKSEHGVLISDVMRVRAINAHLFVKTNAAQNHLKKVNENYLQHGVIPSFIIFHPSVYFRSLRSFKVSPKTFIPLSKKCAIVANTEHVCCQFNENTQCISCGTERSSRYAKLSDNNLYCFECASKCNYEIIYIVMIIVSILIGTIKEKINVFNCEKIEIKHQLNDINFLASGEVICPIYELSDIKYEKVIIFGKTI